VTIQDRKQMGLQGAANRAIDSGQSPTNNREFQTRFLELVQNEFLTRGSFIQRWMDPRRDINKECGYPESYEITSEKWQEYYERHSIAARVVELMPTECWQITPDVYEDDDPNNTTPFEQAFKELAVHLRGSQSFFKAEEEVVHPIWEACRRLDILSGIGQFGVMLLGFNDGLSLNQPVEGWVEEQVEGITWNEEALPFLYEEIGRNVSIDQYGRLIINAKPEEEEEPKPNGKANSKKLIEPKKKKGAEAKVKPGEAVKPGEEQKQSSKKYSNIREPEVFDQKDTVTPSPQAFGNQNPQQGFYRDPMDPEKYKDPKPQGPEQPEPGAVDTSKNLNSPIQPFQEQEEQDVATPSSTSSGRKLLYIRVFPESAVQIVRYETNVNSPRFGQPVLYRITINDPMQRQTGIGMPMSTLEVHYSRVIHVADVGANAVSSEIFAAPRMRPVLNHLIDLQKILGACGEGYWKNAFATLAAETHPQLGGDVTIDTADLRDQMKKWRDSLDRVLAATGVTWRTISPQIVDPNSHVQNQLNAICIKLACPLRVFMGSEMGVLASGQDSIAWSFRVRERRKNYLTPRLIVPLIDRLIQVGVLPQPAPEAGYTVDWNDDQKLLPQEQAQIGAAITGAMATYISGQVDQFIEPITWLVEVMGWDRDRAKAVVQATMEHIQRQQEAQAAQGPQMIDPMSGQPLEQDEMGQYIDPNTGEPMQTDEFGQPVIIDPTTGQPMPAQQQQASESQGPLGSETAEAGQLGFFDDKPQVPYGEDPAEWDGPEQLPGEDYVDPEADQAVQEGVPKVGGGMEEEQAGVQQAAQVDEETGLPIDPETGYLVDEESGYLVDKESGDIYDPESGEVVGNVFDEEDVSVEGEQEDVGQELEGKDVGVGGEEEGEAEEYEQQEVPQAQMGDEEDLTQEQQGEFPVDPQTGRYIISDEGYQLDPATGGLYDAEGQVIGNLRDQ